MKPTNQIINEANSIILAKDKEIENLNKEKETLLEKYNDQGAKFTLMLIAFIIIISLSLLTFIKNIIQIF